MSSINLLYHLYARHFYRSKIRSSNCAFFFAEKGGFQLDFIFIVNSTALGVGLAMDAFSVSLANGLHEPDMQFSRMCGIAGVYAFFQFAMPMLGWIFVHTIVELFSSVSIFVPWIAFLLLLWIGGKMFQEG
ncbi:manganese efflux pump, partial [Candidatus Saccharibacteria bacterium]|nr:manganese efflux pump [Candidatus Saccharibacteria bacterium]